MITIILVGLGLFTSAWLLLGFAGWLLHLCVEGWGKGLHKASDEWVLLLISLVLGPISIYAMTNSMKGKS